MSPEIPRSSHEPTLPSERSQLLYEIEKKAAEIASYDDWRYQPLREYAQRVVSEGSDTQAAAAAEIILNTTLHGNTIPDLLGKWSILNVYEKSQQLIGIAVTEPELAHAIVANNVGGFHGSNSSSLLGVLEHGILSSRDARDRHVPLGSGERTYTDHSRRPFISFADWRAPESLRLYANGGLEVSLTIDDYRQRIVDVQQGVDEALRLWGETHPFAVNGRLVIEDTKRLIAVIEAEPDSLGVALMTANFPVLYGVDVSSFEHVPTSYNLPSELSESILIERMNSDVRGEFVIVNGGVSPESIPIIAVPAAHVEMVRQLVNDAGHGIDVYPIDSLITKHGVDPAIWQV